MTTLEDLYVYYCRRCDCKPNSRFCKEMRDAFDAANGVRDLHVIDLSTNYLGPRGVEPVLEMARNVYSLRRLDLRNNMLEHDDVEKVMRAVCRHPNLQEINLSFNNIHDSSTANLVHLLRTNRNILSLLVDGCDFTIESRQKLEEQLNANRTLWKERCDAAAANADAAGPSDVDAKGPRYTPFRSEVAGVITKETSGGHFHYASWRKNPQFTLHLSKEAFTTITLKIADPQPTRPMGFAVLRGNALLKVVDVSAADILAESPFDDTTCRVQLRLDAAEKVKNSAPYVIVPFTFHPGRSAEFTLAAEIPPEVDGVVTLAPLESRYDWIVTEIAGEWTPDTCGGSLGVPTWRDNDTYRIKYEGSVAKGMATLFFVMSKANDGDDNDEREIGLYLLRPDFRGRVPARITPDSVAHVIEHRRETSLTLKIEVPCGALDFILVPTTMKPGQLGAFTVSVYSTCPLTVQRHIHPHGWAFQQLDGEWDAQRNGGSRSENATTWIHNPCYEVTNNTDGEIDLVVSLERAPPPPTIEGSLGVVSVAPPDSAEGAAAGPIRPRPPVEIGIMVTRVDAELGIVGASAWSQRREAVLALNSLPPGTYYLLPITRRAGQHDPFRLRLFSSAAVHVSYDIPLAKRLREKQLQKYSEENEARRRKLGASGEPPAEGSNAAEVAAAAQRRVAEAVAEARATQRFEQGVQDAQTLQDAAVQQYLRDGTLFIDRDFPRGASSLWKQPDLVPEGAPAIFAWRRPSEIFPGQTLTFAPNFATRGANLQSDFGNTWFHSALALVSTRPDLLAKVIGSYQPQYGIAQFHFFKAGLWRTVTVDDHLPVDAVGALCFAESSDPSDLFVPLAEKAWAKLHRCYEATRAPHDAVREALIDLTGGLCTVNKLYGADGREWAQRSLWKQLMRCRESTELLAFALPQDAPGAAEKKHSGLHIGRLYPILDARDVEAKKLIKVRNFWTAAAPAGPTTSAAPDALQWKGKWAAGSANWTPTIRKAIDYVEEPDSFWLTLDEALYYFGLLYRIELLPQSAWIEGGFSAEHRGGSLLDDTWVNNPQYALTVHATEPVTVHLGIHQPDARMTLLRSAEAAVAYEAQLGLTLIRTDDATRRLMTISQGELPTTLRPSAQRDSVATFTIEPNHSYVIMPFSMTQGRAAQFHVSAHSVAPVSISAIASDMKVSLDGAWEGPSAGGPRGCGSWRNNPQFLLYPSEDAQITVVLRQRNDLASTTAHIGFTVLKARSIRRALHCDEDDVVLDVKPLNDHAVVGTTRFQGMAARKGMPYLIVPSTSEIGVETGFTLEIVANKRVQLKAIDAATDWHTVVRRQTFSYKEGTAGGSLRFSSWRNNPQFTLRFPTERSGSLLIVASNNNANDQNPIGLVLMRADDWDHGRRRKLQLEGTSDILGRTEACVGYCELAHNFQVKREPLILMPFTDLPMTEMDFTLSFYCSSDIVVEPVLDWKQDTAEGRWELGLTAGGARATNRGWINNPFFSLSVTKPTRLLILGLQYPTGPQRPIVRRVGKDRVFLPPPIANEGSKVCFGLDVVDSDQHNTPIASTKHTYEGEVAMMLTLQPCEKTPYFIVPHTFEPEQEADFKVVVYADEPFTLQQHRKARRFF